MSTETESKQKQPKQEQEASDHLPSPRTSAELDKLDAVRDLLFGQNVKEYREEFKELKDMILQEKKDTDGIISKVQSEIMKKLDQLDKKIDQSNQELAQKLNELSQAKTDRESLAVLLKNMADKLTS